ncbi:MAG: hypothetical protein J4473_01895 [Candidatus Aenigmarchaeota archaeon]|nr:hypothetical protein [Candidatus Aenigmarchaeota archaeon]
MPLKDEVIHILAEHWPIGTKRIFNVVIKRRQVSYQAVHQALKELVKDNIIIRDNNQYKLNVGWITDKKLFFEGLCKSYKINNVPNMTIAKIRMYKTPEEFYEHLIRMCKESKTLYLSSKTPALILTKEKNMSEIRKKYVKALKERFTKEGYETKYLFSTELTKKIIIEESDLEAVKNLKKLMKISKLKLRHAPVTSVLAQAIGKKEWLMGFASPAHTDMTGFIHFMSDDLSSIRQIYDSVFSNAFDVKKFVDDVEKELSGRK